MCYPIRIGSCSAFRHKMKIQKNHNNHGEAPLINHGETAQYSISEFGFFPEGVRRPDKNSDKVQSFKFMGKLGAFKNVASVSRKNKIFLSNFLW